jgi:cytidylate kinase
MLIIAVDGPAGAGKGTISQKLSQELNLFHVDTGLFYRALAYEVFLHHLDPKDKSILLDAAERIDVRQLDNPRLRDESIAAIASEIAVIPEVRHILTKKMRETASHAAELAYDGVILDGRDVGTVVCPEAAVKLFITADPIVRANRRLFEMQEKHSEAQLMSYKTALLERDTRDKTRSAAPLEKADDAIVIDTSDLSIDDACTHAMQCIKNKISASFL